MHYLMLATLTALAGETSAEARDRVYDQLLDDPSFCGDGGRFSSSLCDWFVIGGRWSGLLAETLLGDAYKAAFAAEFPEFANGYYPASLAETHRDRLNQFWQQCGGTGDHPVARNSHKHYGCDDDAQMVDHALYRHFLSQYRGESSRKEFSDTCKFADLDGDDVDENFIGRKWLIVIDYHQ